MGRASDEVTLRRFSEGLTRNDVAHQVEGLPGEKLVLVVDEVPLPITVHDGSVNVHPSSREVVSVPVPSRRSRFSSYWAIEGVMGCVHRIRAQEARERARLQRMEPFWAIARAFESASKSAGPSIPSRARIRLGSDVDKDGRIHMEISGSFTLDELKRMMKGIESSEVLNEEIVRQVTES